MSRHAIWFLAASCLLGAPAAAQTPAQPGHARARLLAESTAAVPGKTLWLGMTFEIDPDWHLYWNGVSDTGSAIDLTPTLPQGYRLGPVQWPAPTRHITEHFLDHIYERRVTLLLPVEVPADARVGSTAKFRVEAKWLVCKTICTFGEADLSIELPVAGTAEPASSAVTGLFAEARDRLPKPVKAADPEVKVEWKKDAVVLRAAKGVKGLAFYPTLECAAFSDLATEGESKHDTLELHLDKPGVNDRLVGVVELEPQQPGRHSVFLLEERRGGANPRGPDASDKGKPGGG